MTTQTTNHLRLTVLDHARAWLAQRDPIMLGSVLVIALLIAGSLLRGIPSGAAPIAAVPTPALPIFIVATAQPIPTPTIETQTIAAVLPGTLARAVVAYDAPEGRVIGAIDRGHAYRVVARYGADWLHADVTGSGRVWLRATDVFDLPADLADLAPPPAPIVEYQVVHQPPPPPTLTNDERAAALTRQFGSEDMTGGAALAEHQARQAEVERQKAIQGHYANENVSTGPPLLTSDDLPCNCP